MAEEATTINNSVQDQWGQICSQLKTEVGDTAFDSWLKPLTGSFNDGVMNICVPTRFMRNWVITHYSDRSTKSGRRRIPKSKALISWFRRFRTKPKDCITLLPFFAEENFLQPVTVNIYQAALTPFWPTAMIFRPETTPSSRCRFP
ncbi:MAG: DnaA N-terminal domain-containing protein [Alphaproteobacteria bacterium]